MFYIQFLVIWYISKKNYSGNDHIYLFSHILMKIPILEPNSHICEYILHFHQCLCNSNGLVRMDCYGYSGGNLYHIGTYIYLYIYTGCLKKKVGLVICNFIPLYLRFVATLRDVFVLKIKLWSCSLCLFVLNMSYSLWK